jgi:hypothetical protein
MTTDDARPVHCPGSAPAQSSRRISRRGAIIALGGAVGLLIATACTVPIQRYFSSPRPLFPSWVNSMPRGSEAYTVAFANLDLLATLVCYCGCGSFEDAHANLRDCYLLPSGEMNTHGAFCETCQDEAIEAVAMAHAGTDWAAIREHIDATYGDRAPEFGESGCGGQPADSTEDHGENAACRL